MYNKSIKTSILNLLNTFCMISKIFANNSRFNNLKVDKSVLRLSKKFYDYFSIDNHRHILLITLSSENTNNAMTE